VRSSKKPLSSEAVCAFLRILFAEDLHAKRVLSLAGATLGVIQTASLAVAMIGRGLALAHSTPRRGASNAASATARTFASAWAWGRCVSTPDRRDRLWLLDASAVVLLTLLGAAEEPLGYDRRLKTNTAERRTHSLLRQGHLLYELIPTMPEHRLQPLIEGFATMLVEQPVFAKAFGAI
jgi:hypothetical protein